MKMNAMAQEMAQTIGDGRGRVYLYNIPKK